MYKTCQFLNLRNISFFDIFPKSSKYVVIYLYVPDKSMNVEIFSGECVGWQIMWTEF